MQAPERGTVRKLRFSRLSVKQLSILRKKRVGSEPKPPPAEPKLLSVNSSSYFQPASENLYSETPASYTITYPRANDNRPYISVDIYGITVSALLDSGSNLTLINEAVYNRVKPKKLFPLPDPPNLRTASGEALTVRGKVYLPFSWNGVVRVVPTLVIPNLAINCICGMDFWKTFRIQPTVVGCAMVEYTGAEITPSPLRTPSVLSASEQKTIDNIKSLFNPARPGKLSTTPLAEHKIELAEEWRKKPPVRQFPYVMSPKTQGLVSVELQRLLDAGIIEPSNSDWSLNGDI